jgi:DNA-binding GntR family transcriptional regulator
LATKLGVSRTPIRESLGEIAAIGMIRLKPNHGAVVSPFGPDELRQIYHIRRILEVEATRMASENIDVDALRDIRKQTQDLLDAKVHGKAWSETALALDRKFHQLVSRSAGNERLAEEIGKYGGLVFAVGDAVGNKLQAHEQNLTEHAAIIDCLLDRHGDAAAVAMGHHIDRGAETAAEFLRLKYANG